MQEIVGFPERGKGETENGKEAFDVLADPNNEEIKVQMEM